jgi:hypothetical protein
MYAISHYNDIKSLSVDEWDKLSIEGSVNNLFIYKIQNVNLKCKYIEASEYEAMGWKFAVVPRGYFNIFEDANWINQLNPNNLSLNLKKNRQGQVIDKPARFRYTLDDKDIAQGKAFLEKVDPYVQRTIKSEIRRRRYQKLYRLFKKL